jgi:uncharacterized membrane protein
MLMVHFIGLAMGVGTGMANLFLGRAASKLEKKDAMKFILNTFVLGKMGMIGLTLLILSGGYLLTPYLPNLPNMPTLIAKLSLVILLIVLIGMVSINARKAQKSDPEKYMKRIRILGPIALLTSLLIILMAVLTFH